jgi:superfamily II DNA helicase RecQ
MEQEEREYMLSVNEDYGEPAVDNDDDDDDDDDDQDLIEGDAVDEREAIEIAMSQNMAHAPNVAAHSLSKEENGGERSGSSIIYAPSRKLVEQIAERLASRGYSAMPYHAGLPPKHLKAVHERFLSGTCKVAVCLRLARSGSGFGFGFGFGFVGFV